MLFTTKPVEEGLLTKSKSLEEFNSKVLLFGEYAVLHDGMALVIPCDKYNGHLDFYDTEVNNKFAQTSNQFLKKFSDFLVGRMDEDVAFEVKVLQQELEQGLFFRSTIPQGYGLGSSGALVAAIFLRYMKKTGILDELQNLTPRKLHDLKNILGKLESYFHGTSSGLDPLSIILDEPILYKNAEDITTTELPESSDEKDNVIFLMDSEHPRTTSGMMDMFDALYSDKDFKRKFSDDYVQNNNEAIRSFLGYEPDTFYQSVYDLCKFQLDEMSGFFPESVQEEASGGLDNGDYFLKLCGAGGGGFMLGFTREWDRTQEDLHDYDLDLVYSY